MNKITKRNAASGTRIALFILIIFALFSPLRMMAQNAAEPSAYVKNKFRYQPEVDLGMCLNLNHGHNSYGEVRTVQGIRFIPQFSAGIGIGLQFGSGGVGLPFSLNAKYFIMPEAKVVPFVTADVGWHIKMAPVSTHGPFFEIGPGFRYRKFQLSLTFKPEYIHDSGSKFEYMGTNLCLNAGFWF